MISMGIAAVCAAAVLWVVVDAVPADEVGMWPRVLIVTLFVISVVSSLAITEVIPWRSTSWTEWRKPKVLGAVAGLMLAAAGLIAGIGPLFDPEPADRKTQVSIQKTGEKTHSDVKDIARILRERFPDDPPILKEINGHWGDVEPACDVVYDLRIVRRGSDAALLVQTLKTPAGVPPYRLVAGIVKAEGNKLFVEGVEPEAARGASAHFELNSATRRLTWDDRVRGSGGVEVYKPC